MNAFTLSPQQQAAIGKVDLWLRSDRQVFRLYGYAGTGKTTIAKLVAARARGKVSFAAYTGKAAAVMRANGCNGASTIHSLIYTAREDKETGQLLWSIDKRSDAKNARLIVIDECSMIDERVGRDLLAFGAQVLVLGDPAQLPPVEGSGWFVRPDIEPDVLLTEIHRQALDNPILQLADLARNNRYIKTGTYGTSRVMKSVDVTLDDLLDSSVVICGTNNRRRNINHRIREGLGRESATPVPNDRLVCLRNDHKKGMLNGTMWLVVESEITRGREAHQSTVAMTLRSDDDEEKLVTVHVPAGYFTARSAAELEMVKKDFPSHRPMEYGYCITCHKSQGSQFAHPLIFDESHVFGENAARWRYTAISRAVDAVTLVK
jgi:exodeoxyribonuclease-5